MEKLLKHINDQENLQLWNDRKNWSDDDESNKVYVEEDCPSFKEMIDKEVFQDMEKIAKQLEVEYPLTPDHFVLPEKELLVYHREPIKNDQQDEVKKSETPTLQEEQDSECDTLPSDIEEEFQEKYAPKR